MFKNRTIEHDATLIEALKKMDALDKKLLMVLRGNKFAGLLSVGDIQRAVIQNKPLDIKVSEVLRKNIRIAAPEDELDTIRKMMFDFRMELCPVVATDNEIVAVYFWEDVFQDNKLVPKGRFKLPVVIIAGGLGARLKPLTNVLPKPLIPIGEKTMLEEIFDRFIVYGCNDFYVSINYKAELIKYYIDSLHLPLNIDYFIEKMPMGTAGSLSLLKDKIKQTFFVSNCDILIEQDYSEILAYHRENENEITIVAALKHFPIAYGTLETGDNGHLTELTEKPELTFKINSGMYLLEPHLIDEIPCDKVSNITDLIWDLKKNNRKVGVFPVSQNSWIDIGDWKEYFSVLERKNIQFGSFNKK